MNETVGRCDRDVLFDNVRCTIYVLLEEMYNFALLLSKE